MNHHLPKVILLASFLVLPLDCTSADRSRLWLPSSYKQHFSKLRRAAELVEKRAHRCVEIIDGSLSQDLSTPDRPVFRLICRSENRRTHALKIDGITLEVVDLKRPGGRVSFDQLDIEKRLAEEEEERRRLEAERLKVLQRQEAFWKDCLLQLQARTKNMRSLQWLTKTKPDVDVSKEGVTRFLVDFDAEDIYKKALRYRGVCDYRTEEDFQVRIRPRRGE